MTAELNSNQLTQTTGLNGNTNSLFFSLWGDKTNILGEEAGDKLAIEVTRPKANKDEIQRIVEGVIDMVKGNKRKCKYSLILIIKEL